MSSIEAVLKGESRWYVEAADCLEGMRVMPERSVDLVCGSPPYLKARTYGRTDVARDCAAWVDWMLEVTTEAVRICRGLVVWVVAGSTEKGVYQPGPEGLCFEWWKRGGCLWRPAIWTKNGIPGSGQKQQLRNDWEYMLVFKRPGNLPWADPLAKGHPPLWGPGGEMSNRTKGGKRVNQWGGGEKSGGTKRKNGEQQPPGRPSHRFPVAPDLEGQTMLFPEEEMPAEPAEEQPEYFPAGGGPFGNQPSSCGRRASGEQKPPYFSGKRSTVGNAFGGVTHSFTDGDGKRRTQNGFTGKDSIRDGQVLANPGNVMETDFTEAEDLWIRLHATVGGGHLGHKSAHANEAPYPEAIPDFWISCYCPPDGVVCDPYLGSGTTGAVAVRLGRRALGFDLRQSQVDLAYKRISGETPPLFPGEV